MLIRHSRAYQSRKILAKRLKRADDVNEKGREKGLSTAFAVAITSDD